MRDRGFQYIGANMVDLKCNTDEALKALNQLPKKVQKRMLRKAAQAAGDTILIPLEALAPERTDEETPGGNALPPGILKADLHTQVVVRPEGVEVKVGPGEIAGHVARWQNNGWTLTSHRKDGHKKIKDIPGKHFFEAAFDEAGEKAVDVFCQVLAQQLGLDNGPDESSE